MRLVDYVTAYGAVVGFVGGVVFLGYYMRIPWWRSRTPGTGRPNRLVRETGWHIVTFTFAATALTGLRAATTAFGDRWPGQAWTRAIMILLVAFAMWWRFVMSVRLQRAARRQQTPPPETEMASSTPRKGD